MTAKEEDNMFIQHYHDTLKNNKLIWSGGKGGIFFLLRFGGKE